MGRSIPSFALVFAILLGLAGRVGTVIVHAHDGGDAAHHHDDRCLVGYAAATAPHRHAADARGHHAHDHDADPDPEAPAPQGPSESPGEPHPEHAHYAASDGPILRRCSASTLAVLPLEVVALSVARPDALRAAALPPRDDALARAPRRERLRWPSASTLERRITGLGLLL